MRPPGLLAVPNVSEGADSELITALGASVAPTARLLDVHSDADHGRSVFTFAAGQQALSDAMLAFAALAVERVDIFGPGRLGQHPHVGAVDVAPVVYLREQDRGCACAEALVIAERIAVELAVPVFLYGELTASAAGGGRTRAELRRGGIQGLAARMAGESGAEPIVPDFGPPRPHPRAGVTLVAARPPLVAFNLQLAAPATLEDARRIAALIREGGSAGLPGLRAIGIELAGGVAQVSMNVERPSELALAEIVAAVAALAPIADAEIVGLCPACALEGFPADLEIRDFDPAVRVIENALGS